MCKTPLHGLLEALPKCEHHLHLEGTLSPELLFTLAERNQVALPADAAYASPAALRARYAAFTSLDDFLDFYNAGVVVLRTAADFEELAYAYLSRAARTANVRHAEVFFDPQAHTARGVAVATVVAGFHAAALRAQADHVVSALLVPCLLRHLPVDDAAACFDAMLAAGLFSPTGTGNPPLLAGLGLCSTELARPPSAWAGIFAAAAAQGIRRTAHAGEEGPAAYVAGALDHLGAQRIDHGTHAVDDSDLLARLAAQRVLVTACPVSNVVLRVSPSLKDTPLRAYLAAGVRFSVNSDDPAYFGDMYLQEVYCAVQEAFAFSVDDWALIARSAIEGSWCGDERKRSIGRELDKVLEDWHARTEGTVAAAA
ncbi:hypothetical protein B0T26DRAFT_743642 [Lasiosphaeria miniovina]|uniref:Adenine deaminase n=1 Tax=Lasiosphaeria miniovina TaxID=1954250 RepID=A0AA39ZZ89_9PEZI|nr:uncharacterized protein B0T26DRAFT_743642 [Lasiosphaeria miniovina]KAK0706360.1 hypothetical protein B0T26DRAFT_743642 [Lasiosphaeria miniovina]